MTHKKLTASLVAVITGASLILGVLPAAADTLNTDVSGSVGAPITSASVDASSSINIGRNRPNPGGHRGFASTSSSTREQNQLNRIDNRSDTEIDTRIKALTNLSDRIQNMKHVSDSEKSGVSAEVDSTIGELTNLKAEIAAGTDASTTKAEEKTITADFRIFALVIPQGYIQAAVDRIQTMTQLMTTISTKLQARITAAQTAGKDTTAVQASLTDFSAKMADANTQATAALNLVVNLKPDQGDTTIAASNKAALLAARADIKTAVGDLDAARKDVKSIVSALKGFHLNVTASSTSTTTTSQ